MNAEQNVVDAPFDQEQRAVQSVEDGNGERGGEGGGGFELDENGQRVPHGMGQSKSSRRRRRKRKMKTGEAGEGVSGGGEAAESAEGPVAEGTISSVQAAAAQGAGRQQQGAGRGNQGSPQQGLAQSGSPHAGQNGNGTAPGGTKRWKKKFRDRDRPRTAGSDNPGNQAGGATSSGSGSGGYGARDGYSSSGTGSDGGGLGRGQFRGQDTHQPGNGGGFKRKGGFGGSNGGGKQGRSNGGGGSRGGFVGPMDHSYRAVNGNFTDTPPSTMDPYSGGGRRGGYSGDSQPIDYSQGRSVPIAPDAPTHIYFFIEDLFITAKVQETARKLGVKVAFVKNDKESIAQLTAGEDNDRPSLIVFDLNNASAKPMTLMPKLKAKLKKSVSIIGFLSHLQGDLKAKAMESGCDTVMPRAAFSQNLPNLLRRYGIEDTEEVANYNQ